MTSHEARLAVPWAMRVAVGSANPVERGAAEDALRRVAGTVVESVDVDSGVSERPAGHGETLRGTEIRARRAHAAGEYDLGVGIEGGVEELPWGSARDCPAPGDADDATPADGLYLITWAAATDGDGVGRGAGPCLRLPEHVAGGVRAGEELGPVVDDAFDLANVSENEGAVGVLTGRAIDRRSALAHAVAGALGPFVTGC